MLDAYLPAQLGDDEIAAIVTAGIEQTGAVGMKAMGQVMKAVTPQIAGRAEGGRVAAEVRRQLGQLATAAASPAVPLAGEPAGRRARPARPVAAPPPGPSPFAPVPARCRSPFPFRPPWPLPPFFFGGVGLLCAVAHRPELGRMSAMTKFGAGLARLACKNVICQVCAGALAPNISPGQP